MSQKRARMQYQAFGPNTSHSIQQSGNKLTVLHDQNGDRKGMPRGSPMMLYPIKGHANATTANAWSVWH